MSTSRALSHLLPLVLPALMVPACLGGGGSASWGNEVFTAAESERSDPRPAAVEGNEEPRVEAPAETGSVQRPSLAKGLEECLLECDALLRQGRAREVLQTLEELRQQHPENVPVLLALGRALLGLDQPEKALAALQQAKQLDPGAADLPRLLGIALLSCKKTEEGVAILRQELAEGAGPADAALTLASYFQKREALADAVACLEQATTRQPERQDLLLLRAGLLTDMSRPAEALKVLEGMDGESRASPAACVEKLIALRMLGDSRAALEVLQKLLAEDKIPPGQLEEFRGVESDLRQEIKLGHRVSYIDRDFLAMLRASPSVSVRVRSLKSLVRRSRLHAERAINLAIVDPSPELRAEGVRQAVGRSENPLHVLRLGLSDADALVRAVAAEMGGYLGQQLERASKAVPGLAVREVEALILEFLEAEPDPYAFRQMHEALQRASGVKVDLPYKGEYEAKTRQKVVSAWRARR